MSWPMPMTLVHLESLQVGRGGDGGGVGQPEQVLAELGVDLVDGRYRLAVQREREVRHVAVVGGGVVEVVDLVHVSRNSYN